jgi:hypothetical protein
VEATARVARALLMLKALGRTRRSRPKSNTGVPIRARKISTEVPLSSAVLETHLRRFGCGASFGTARRGPIAQRLLAIT